MPAPAGLRTVGSPPTEATRSRMEVSPNAGRAPLGPADQQFADILGAGFAVDGQC